MVDLKGGVPVHLTNFEYRSYFQLGAPYWSLDGSMILFVYGPFSNPDIFVMDAKDDDLTNLTKDKNGWAPEGTKIAFISDRDGMPELFVMNMDGSEQASDHLMVMK